MKWARSMAMAGATAAALTLAVAAPARADLTITETMGGKMFGPADISGTRVTRIKGHKMRQDTTRKAGDETSMIFDVDDGKIIILNNSKKEAIVRSTADFGEAMNKISGGDIKADMTATAETKTVAGQSCTIYNADVAVSFAMAEKMPPITMIMKGPVCLSKSAPGNADFKAFYLAASEKGFMFTDPASAKAQPGMAKAMSTMLQKMADGGLPLSSDMSMTFEGDNPMAQMMKKMGSGQITTEATKVETGTLGDDLFAVPPGYKVSTK